VRIEGIKWYDIGELGKFKAGERICVTFGRFFSNENDETESEVAVTCG
jgi:hypothetical protein